MPVYNLPGYWTPSQAARYVSGYNSGIDMQSREEYEAWRNQMLGGTPSGTSATTGTLTGSPGQPGKGSQGGVPTVPDPATTAAAALRANQGLIQDLTALGQQITGANAAAAMVPFKLNLPYFTENWNQAGLNTSQLLKGEIPEADVNALINSVISKMGITSGLSADSPAVRSALARTVLGSEYAAQQKGLEDLKQLMGMTPTGPAFDASSMLIKPSEMQDWQYLANVLSQSPNPDAAAWANLANVFAGMRSGGAGGAGTTGGSAADKAAEEARRHEMQVELAKILAGGRGGTTPGAGTTTAPSPRDPYGGLSVDTDLENWMRELGYDPSTGEELWPSNYYGGTDTTNYYSDYYGDTYTPEEGQYWPGPY